MNETEEDVVHAGIVSKSQKIPEFRPILEFATNRSNRYEANSFGPFLGIRGCPDQQQVFDGSANVEVLGNDNNARTRSGLSEAREIAGHRFPIVGDENSIRLR